MISVLAAVLILLGVYAYSYYVKLQTQAGPRVSVLSPPLEFWIELDKAAFLQGENVSIRVGLRNASNETVNATWFQNSVSNRQWVFFDFSVMDENGTVVFSYYGTHGRTDGTWERTLTPRQQLIVTFSWLTEDENYALVPKGDYSVRASTRNFELALGSNSTYITLETPTISIAVL